MMQYKMTFVLSCAISVMAAFGVVDGYIVPLASNPTNVKTRSWDLPGIFGKVTIPGATISDTLRYSYVGDDNGRGNTFYSPLQPVDPSQQEASEEYRGYESYPRSRSTSLFSLAPSSIPSPLSTGSVWRSNNNLGGKNTNSFGKSFGNSRSFTRGTPALAMANYMQNGGPGNSYNDNRDYNDNNYDNRVYSNNNSRDNYDYDDIRGRNYYDDDFENSRRDSRPRGTNRLNTVGSVGNVNGSNYSRTGRSMQFQNRQDSNTAGRSGRMNGGQFAPDSNSRFESRRPNDNYSRGGYRQDSRTGHWTDPNSNYNINDSPRTGNRYGSSSSSSFRPVPPGDYVSVPRVPTSYDRGTTGAGGNVPYDSAYYNNNNYEYRGDFEDYGDSDFYSRNGNIMNNRRGSRGNSRGGSPGMNENYYTIGDYKDSNRRLDRGGGIMRYRPNNQRAYGGYYGNGYGYEVGPYDDYYDSSGSFYNHEGKRVRRYDRYSDRYEGFYNPDHLSNDLTDPDRVLQNQRRREGRDVTNGAHLRRYDPEWDSNQGLYDEDSLYRNDVTGTRSYDIENRFRGRRRGNYEDPSVLRDGWGETGGRPFSPYEEGDRIEDGYDRGQARFRNNSADRYRLFDSGDNYDDYNRGRGSMKRGLGRRDMDDERDYYRSNEYGGPNIRSNDSMERFRQGKDVRKTDLYGYETGNTPSSKRRITRRKNDRRRNGDYMREGRTVNGSYNAPRNGRGRMGRDRGMSLDDLNEML